MALTELPQRTANDAGPGSRGPAPSDLLPPPLPAPAAAPSLSAPIEEKFHELLGDIYSDAYTGLGRIYVGAPVPELDEKRLKRRGQQLALVLGALGWDDAEIVAMAALTAGLVSDGGQLYALKVQHEEQKAAAGAKA